MDLTDGERAFLAAQRLGRLATVDPHGAPQNNPVGFFLNASNGTIDIGGHSLAASRKFRNVLRNPHVALVIDELASVRPWTVRGMEIRGEAEALTDQEPPGPGFGPELIRITPRVIFSWGVEPDTPGMLRRTVG
ncbi:PPOX class F420-dependent oxidoreductase [Thermomonospora umbrina]|uniref:Pyridoxamine 5'-phosphate oxidase family protein n=1 Tax=Thermomonospora umbrina TaxID=111806 RepID=A0A3D9SV45_9ACTN|nr:PPOX class F420-dependent oxidoreductase [Thermomonospora umbrina]REE99822.1 pyridoxamine 5'-phosphate oxidase family protein [Thermomonospora umbrina]